MIKFQTRKDVLDFVKVFGYAALQHAMDKMTISPDQTMLIRMVKATAYKNDITLAEINDGNTVREVIVSFESPKIGGFHTTMLGEITVTVYGQGGGVFTVKEAMENGTLNKEKLEFVLKIIKERNEARDILES